MTSDNPDEMLSAWTPGPWLADGLNVCARRTRWVIAATDDGGFGRPKLSKRESEANARLIAAAPDLAEALRKAREVLANYADPSGYYDGDGEPYSEGPHPGTLAAATLPVIDAALSRLNP